MKNINYKTKILLSILFPILLTVWNLSFELGTFGSILYRNVITAWVFAVSTFIALIYLRIYHQITIRLRSFILLLMPITWPIVGYVDHHFSNIYLHYLITIDYVFIVAGLLYAAYLFLRIIKNDLFDPLNVKNRLFILIAAMLFSTLGFFAGRHNHLFLECQHFELSGDYIPSGCYDTKAGGVLNLYH